MVYFYDETPCFSMRLAEKASEIIMFLAKGFDSGLKMLPELTNASKQHAQSVSDVETEWLKFK